ncbi:TRAP transporter substrate-binding protein DctP [Roseomonas sp. NAR14]|uniref:TRAP transporter substrate-binding protein DctP n=1 Tax=Roseomonas acroporae TaxID=2937791 RepID=A0A9X1YCC9_9PROT|nr:TRAP transporter substrate-binding protein DctP [Roseomonas acroporae]MCK8787824.1 TRAP transporter substrate-binding protein DctP [Roseomonas acroporae]
MNRRGIIGGAALAAGTAAVLATPALAQGAPTVRWRLQTAWPRSLDTIHGSAEALARRVSQLTDGKFEIRVFASGEVAPPGQILDAVQNGTVEAGHVLASFFTGRSPAYAFDAGLPFGMNARQQSAWLHDGGGLALLREFWKKSGMVNLPVGNVGVQMGGFFRREIRTVEDLRGLKMRIGGIGGQIFAKLGAVPQQIPTADIYPALERGTIDAAEWIGPYDDEKLGLNRVAQFYYTPGWWEGSAAVTAPVNLAAWEALPAPYRAALECAGNEQYQMMLASYDAKNPDALRKLLAQGTQLRAFPRAVLEAAYKASFEHFDELSRNDADFRAIYPSWRRFLENSNPWFRVAEQALDNFRFGRDVPPPA